LPRSRREKPSAPGQDRAGRRTSPRVASGYPGDPARWRELSFFARDAVAEEVAPERCHAGERPLTRQALLQLGQCHVRHRGERGRDQAGMGLRAIREPITTLWLGPSIATSPTQSLPADRARGADTEPRRRLATGQTRVNGAQNTRPEIEMQRSRHEGRPPLPANTLNQIATFSATPPTQSARKTL